jgi:competence protein ComEC
LAAGGAFWLLVPCRMPGKAAAAAALLPLAFWPAPRLLPGELRLTMLDVGQGQSILLETARHAVLYDAGPAYPGSGTDAARQVALPYLARRGIGRLSALIVSHRDLDHAGGMRRVLEGLPVEARYGSWVDAEDAASPPMRLCQKGEGWEFDGVRFEFLHPRGESQPEGKNQDSCVLKVSAASGRALLAGDIGKKEEQALLLAGPGSLSAELLAMPHHGSRHSSSLPFLAAVGPAWSFASAGWGNRFGHPHPDALMRHEALGIAMRRTDHDGALTALFAGGKITVEGERQRRKRYWQD